MPGFNDTTSNAVATPGRKTRITLDLTEQVILENAWAASRFLYEISPLSVKSGYADGDSCSGMRQWFSGAITLRPRQDFLPWIVDGSHDTVDPKTYTYQPDNDNAGANLLAAQTLKPVPAYQKPDLPGVSVDPGVQSSGHVFLQKQHEAGDSWSGAGSVLSVAPTHQPPAASVLVPPDTTLPPVPGVPIQIPSPGRAAVSVDPVAYSTFNAREDQGFFFQWQVLGSGIDNADYVAGCQFGQYQLHVMGDGNCQLFEATHDASGAEVFRLRDTFNYCKPSEVANQPHTMIILPLLGKNGGKYIHFQSSHREDEHFYLSSTIKRNGDRDEAPGHVTKAGIAMIYHRQDLRPMMNFSLLRFEQQGFVVDQPHSIPKTPFAHDPHPLGCLLSCRIPPPQTGNTPYQISMEIGNAGDGDNPTNFPPFDTLIFTHDDNGAKSTAATEYQHVYQKFWFFGDGWNTPVLYGYHLSREAVVDTIAPGEFSIVPEEVGFMGGDLTPESESGRVFLQDPGNNYPRLGVRGEFSCKVTTPVLLPGGASKEIVVFRGIAERPHGKRIGVRDPDALREGTIQGLKTGMGWEGSQIRQYPSSEWRQYELVLTGMWRRLANDEKSTRLALTYKFFSEDPVGGKDKITGSPVPWKVTDIMKVLLSRAGFPDHMIGIGDNPIRLFPGTGSAPENQYLDIYTDFLRRITTLARSYLGAILIFDPNAGTEGQWRLIYGAGTAKTPVFHFLTYAHDPLKLPHMPGAYPSNTGFISELGQAYPVAPESNHVWTFTFPTDDSAPNGFRFEQHYRNFKSYKVPGSTVEPDPNSAHYIGHERLYVCPDPSLCFDDDPQQTQAAVDFVGRRLFDYTCLGRNVQPITCPYYVIQDPELGHWRPFVVGDPVTINGETGWHVRNSNPGWRHDTMQTTEIELEKVAPYP